MADRTKEKPENFVISVKNLLSGLSAEQRLLVDTDGTIRTVKSVFVGHDQKGVSKAFILRT